MYNCIANLMLKCTVYFYLKNMKSPCRLFLRTEKNFSSCKNVDQNISPTWYVFRWSFLLYFVICSSLLMTNSIDLYNVVKEYDWLCHSLQFIYLLFTGVLQRVCQHATIKLLSNTRYFSLGSYNWVSYNTIWYGFGIIRW